MSQQSAQQEKFCQLLFPQRLNQWIGDYTYIQIICNYTENWHMGNYFT